MAGARVYVEEAEPEFEGVCPEPECELEPLPSWRELVEAAYARRVAAAGTFWWYAMGTLPEFAEWNGRLLGFILEALRFRYGHRVELTLPEYQTRAADELETIEDHRLTFSGVFDVPWERVVLPAFTINYTDAEMEFHDFNPPLMYLLANGSGIDVITQWDTAYNRMFTYGINGAEVPLREPPLHSNDDYEAEWLQEPLDDIDMPRDFAWTLARVLYNIRTDFGPRSHIINPLWHQIARQRLAYLRWRRIPFSRVFVSRFSEITLNSFEEDFEVPPNPWGYAAEFPHN